MPAPPSSRILYCCVWYVLLLLNKVWSIYEDQLSTRFQPFSERPDLSSELLLILDECKTQFAMRHRFLRCSCVYLCILQIAMKAQDAQLAGRCSNAATHVHPQCHSADHCNISLPQHWLVSMRSHSSTFKSAMGQSRESVDWNADCNAALPCMLTGI